MLRGYINIAFLRRHVIYVTVAALYICIGIILLLFVSRWSINPDASSYFTIAEKYANGNLRQAISGYWGPLFSWLLVPFVWLHIPMDLAARSIMLLSGLGVLTVVYAFLYERRINSYVIGVVLIAVSAYALEWTMLGDVTPDIIITFLTVLLAYMALRFMEEPTRHLGAAIGIVGAAMYYAKGFGLFLFLGTIAVVVLWQWVFERQRNIKMYTRQYVPILVVFVILTVPFIGIISLKYKKLTINQAGDYNYRVLGPRVNANDPMVVTGPWTPPNDSAISVWEAPIVLINSMPDWSPLESKSYLKHFLLTIRKNLGTSLAYFKDTSPWYTVGAVALIAGCFQRKRFQKEYVLLTAITIMMIAGYSLVLTLPRYLWAGALFTLLALGLTIGTLGKPTKAFRLQYLVGAIIIAACVMGTFLQHAVYARTSVAPGVRAQHNDAIDLDNVLPDGTKVISDSFSSFYYCYYGKLTCYSVLNPPVERKAREDYYRLLKQSDIKILIDMHTRPNDENYNAFISEYYKLNHQSGWVTVYELK